MYYLFYLRRIENNLGQYYETLFFDSKKSARNWKNSHPDDYYQKLKNEGEATLLKNGRYAPNQKKILNLLLKS